MALTVCLKRWSAISSRVTSGVASTGGEDLCSVSRVNKPERTALTLSRTPAHCCENRCPTERLDHHRGRGQQQITVKHVTTNNVTADQAIIADNVTTVAPLGAMSRLLRSWLPVPKWPCRS